MRCGWLVCAVVVLGWIPIAAAERVIAYRLPGVITVASALVGATLGSGATWLVRRRY